jgi:uncharacterized coiled-coil protein SlyX
MALVKLVHPREEAEVSPMQLISKCTLFKNNLALLSAPYRITSRITAEVFRAFVSALEDRAVEITAANSSPLLLLSGEFGFEALAADLSAFRSSAPMVADGAARSRIADLEERALAWDRTIAALQAGLVSSVGNLARLSSAVEFLRAVLETAESRTSAKASELELGHSRLQSESVRLSSALESLRAEVSAQKTPPPPTKTLPAAREPPFPAHAPPARAPTIAPPAPIPVSERVSSGVTGVEASALRSGKMCG